MNALATRVYGVTEARATAAAVEALKRANPLLAGSVRLKPGIPIVVPVVPGAPAPAPAGAPELVAGSGAPPFADALERIRVHSMQAAKERKKQAALLVELAESPEVKQLAHQDLAVAKLVDEAIKTASAQLELEPPIEAKAFEKLEEATALLLGLSK